MIVRNIIGFLLGFALVATLAMCSDASAESAIILECKDNPAEDIVWLVHEGEWMAAHPTVIRDDPEGDVFFGFIQHESSSAIYMDRRCGHRGTFYLNTLGVIRADNE